VPGEIQQIFANLLTNAIEAMPEGGRIVVRIRPSLDWSDRAIAGLRITFCDSGVGMDKATRRRMFDPFFTTKTDTGTGLGMWVVSQLVERHKGHIRVWSTQRMGRSATVFSVFLPFDELSTRLHPGTTVESQAMIKAISSNVDSRSTHYPTAGSTISKCEGARMRPPRKRAEDRRYTG
jgi:hypothetical protein